ncbi:MAG: tRNA uracil 4-sulfurtransferase ThiI [Vicinamibacteria bacterium]
MGSVASELPLHIVIRSPEITLKGRNQGEFWNRLRENVRQQVGHLGFSWPVTTARARLVVEVERELGASDLERALASIGEVAGVDSFSAARRLDRHRAIPREGELDRALLEEVFLGMARACYEPRKSFAIRVHRVDKRFPMTSSEMEFWLGDLVRTRTEWSEVDLDSPDRTFYVDVYREALYFYVDRRKGVGGLPVGTSGQVLSLMSGGIDSPVASFLLARRGATVDWFHMSASHPAQADFDSSAVGRIARRLSRTTRKSRLYLVPYAHFDLALAGRETGYEPVLFRRFLFRTAEALARRIGASALVTGDSLGQVASQTLENLVASTKAVDTLVLRPLVGMDKQQIMDIARRIGTYEISIEPYKDCCALFARNVKTRTQNEALSLLEQRLIPDYPALVARTLSDIIWSTYECGELVSVGSRLEAPAAAR